MKKLSLILVALLLTLSMAIAANAATPSVMATDVPITNATTSTGAPIPPDFMTDVSVPEQISPVIQATFTALSEAITSGEPLSQALALPEETVAAINDSLAASGLTLDNLTLSEFIPLQVGVFNAEELGNVSSEFEFMTPFTEGEALVVLVGVTGADGAVQWLPCPAVATASGSVQITFPAEVLAEMVGKQVMLAVLSEPEPVA
jgi:hypothetical protein